MAPRAAPTGAAVDINRDGSESEDVTLNLTVRCFDGKSVSVSIRSTQKIAELKSSLQRMTGHHTATQRLVFAGATLKDEEAVGATSLVDGAMLFMLALKTFPATLGPFRASCASFMHRDFELPPLDMCGFDDQGAMWVMEQRAAARHGLRAGTSGGIEFPLCGQFSPPHPVTLTDEEKAAINIPAAAKEFVFSYPTVAWDALVGGTDEARSFLSVGGYAYLDAGRKIIYTTTLLPTSKDSGGLQFKGNRKWRPEWTAGLMKQGRFQKITIAPLNKVGAWHFCWLRPGEVINGEDGRPCAEQPNVEHGGFAYLFHREVFKASEEELQLDRYFPIASGDDYVADEVELVGGDATEEDAAAAARSFETVSNLAQLHDLVEEAAAAASAGTASAGEEEELRTRINTLEVQLESVTRCVCCLVDVKDTVLMPCRHLCACMACAERLTRCPICRAHVHSRSRSFL